MRPYNRLCIFVFITLLYPLQFSSAKSWFGSDSNDDSTPTKWTQNQYAAAQKHFQDLKDDTFDTWSDSRLREALREHGVIAEPPSPRESLVQAVKDMYSHYTDAAASYATQATSSASSAVTQATTEVARAAESGKDYVYSSWDDSKLKEFLVKKGVLKSDAQSSREEMLDLMNKYYRQATDPVWKAWSDSYIRDWLITHNIIKSDFQKNRDALFEKMSTYYYNASDSVWSTWSESELRKWLVDHGVVKNDEQLSKEKMQKLMESYYPIAPSTIYAAWSDSDMRAWLIDHGYLRSDAQVKRDELIKLMRAKYNNVSSTVAVYLSWPDSRLRAYLVEYNIISPPPTKREELLQKVREKWSPPQKPGILERLRDAVSGSVEATEEKLRKVREILEEAGGYMTGTFAIIPPLLLCVGLVSLWAVGKAGEGQESLKDKVNMVKDYSKEGGNYAKEKKEDAETYAREKKEEAESGAREARERVEKKKQKVTGEL